MPMKRQILVTGASGMIGSELCKELIRQGYSVIGISRSEGKLTDEKYQHAVLDLKNQDRVETLFAENNIERVIHLAALAHTQRKQDFSYEEYHLANVICAKNVFQSAANHHVPILYISTVDVYGFAKEPVSAETKTAPISSYAKTKLEAEYQLQSICKEQDTPYSIFRFSPVYTDTVKRDIQKRYYLKYPNLAYRIGKGTEYEVLHIKHAIKEILTWCESTPANNIRIIKDPVRMNTADYLTTEKKEGRAKRTLVFPRLFVSMGYHVLRGLTGKNKFTFLLHKAVFPYRSVESIRPKVLFISSSGGHYEQLKMLKPQMEKYDSRIITEKVLSAGTADYYMIQISHTDKWILFKFLADMAMAIKIWHAEKPEYIISTGSMIVIPFAILAKITGKKIIFIETFAKRDDPTLTGKLMYKWADLFIIQWESLRKCYPDATFGGCIY